MSYRRQQARAELAQITADLTKKQNEESKKEFAAGKHDPHLHAQKWTATEESSDAIAKKMAEVAEQFEAHLDEQLVALTPAGHARFMLYLGQNSEHVDLTRLDSWIAAFLRARELNIFKTLELITPGASVTEPDVEIDPNARAEAAGVWGSDERRKWERQQLLKQVNAEREIVWRSALQKLIARGYFISQEDQDVLYDYMMTKSKNSRQATPFTEQSIYEAAKRLVPECAETQAEQRVIAMGQDANVLDSRAFLSKYGLRVADFRSLGGTRRIEGTGF